MVGLNFKELKSAETQEAPKSSKADNRKAFEFPDSPMLKTPEKNSGQKRRPIITEDSSSSDESEESYFDIEDTPELDHPARTTPELSLDNERSQNTERMTSYS